MTRVYQFIDITDDHRIHVYCIQCTPSPPPPTPHVKTLVVMGTDLIGNCICYCEDVQNTRRYMLDCECVPKWRRYMLIEKISLRSENTCWLGRSPEMKKIHVDWEDLLSTRRYILIGKISCQLEDTCWLWMCPERKKIHVNCECVPKTKGCMLISPMITLWSKCQQDTKSDNKHWY